MNDVNSLTTITRHKTFQLTNNNNNNNLETIPGKHSIDSLQKTAILGTSHIIRKVLQCEA
jgi:hypothetical protein